MKCIECNNKASVWYVKYLYYKYDPGLKAYCWNHRRSAGALMYGHYRELSEKEALLHEVIES